MIEYLWHFIPYLFASLILVALTETILSARWSFGYFSTGISVYRRTIMVKPAIGRTITADMIESALPDSGWYAQMLVRASAKTVLLSVKRCSISASATPPSCTAASHAIRTGDRLKCGATRTGLP